MRNVLIAVFCILWVLTASAHAQTGVISGRVVDEAGQPLPGANVQVTGGALSGPTGSVAANNGSYRVDQLPEGAYTVTVSFIGYRTFSQIVRISRDRPSARLDVRLQATELFGSQIVVTASRGPEKLLDAPASVSSLDGAQFQDAPSLTIVENARGESGVDHAKAGLIQNNTVVRGFNNVFSGALLTLTDYRISAVPSLRLNANNFIPATSLDVDHIEIVRGPASALYGPNSANGMLHIITRSPIGSEGTAVSLGGGERSLRTVSFRHAGSRNGKVGFKISGQYFAGTDWKYVDPEELIANGGANPRDYDIQKLSGELRVDVRPAGETELIFTTGISRNDNIDLTGLGAGQAIDWTYRFTQARLSWRDWFAHVYHNRSDAGGTFLLRTNGKIVDTSTLTVLQLQHAAGLGSRQHFVYGSDVLLTRPNTSGSINGKFEDRDDINEVGFFVQSETALSDRIDLILAGRYDDHNHIEDPVFSPRAALVVKPRPTHAFRFTYNRAFSTPTANNLFLDLVNSRDAFGIGAGFAPALGYRPDIDVRTQGVADGFTFRRDGQGLPMFRSPFAPVGGIAEETFLPLHDPAFTNVMWGVARGAVLAAFVPTFRAGVEATRTQQLIAGGTPPDQARAQAAAEAAALAGAVPGIVPGQLPGLRNALARLNVETRGFDPVADAQTSVSDIPTIVPTINSTFEAGYRGVAGNRFIFSADVYRSEYQDFVGPLRVETPNVFLESGSLGAALGPRFAQALADTANRQLAQALLILDAPSQGGNGNGSALEELTRLFIAGTAGNGAAYIPFGTITPEQASDPSAVALTYRNFGEITLWGLDLAGEFHPDDRWTLSGNYSFVSKDLFPNLDRIADIALNAPMHKVNLGLSWRHAQSGLKLGGSLHHRSGFPMDSGVYVGDVEAATTVDLALAYDIPESNPDIAATFSISASNVFDNAHREFVGAPEIGRLVTSGLVLRF